MAGINPPLGFSLHVHQQRTNLMKKISCLTYGALLALALYSAAITPAIATDPACNQIKAAMEVQRTRPLHIYMTETQSITNPNMARAAAQIGLGGTKHSEEISTGKNVYVMTDGKWIDMQTSFAAMEQDKDSDPDTKKAWEESRCKALPDEAMYGQSASVYLQTTPSQGIQMKIWISKSTNRPVRVDMTNDAGTMKILTVSRYEYSGVQAPAHVVTMEDMVKSRGGR
jgi:hypothetical protein